VESNAPPDDAAIAFHLVPEAWFTGQPDTNAYLPEHFDADGFVHLTHGIVNVLAVGNAFYRDDPRPYVLLTIDLTAVAATVRYDDAARRYPHVYGPLERAAIIAVRHVERDRDGAFLRVVTPDDTATGRRGTPFDS
jgi:uncharacterized protein (DUF952 family)